MNEFFPRLRQRKLVQWAVAYVAAAFALIQGINLVAQSEFQQLLAGTELIGPNK